MSTQNNTDAVANQGEFSSRIAPSEPLTTSGHQPGKFVGNDAVPEFHAETLPAGSAPADHTFQPQPDSSASSTPATALDRETEIDVNAAPPTASDTVTGATSGDVHTGYGHPGSGQSSREQRHDNERGGLQGVGATTEEFKTVK